MQQADGFFRRFIQQFKAEVAQACGKELGQVSGAGLGAGVEHGVAAADIGSNGMRFADAVTYGNSVMVAGTATGEMVFALGEKSGEDAVFHMKHRDVLVKGQFEPSGWSRVEKFKELGDIEIVARGETFQPFGDEKIGGEGIRHVEGEVADHGKFGGSEVIESAKVADENSIGSGVLDQAKKSRLSSFLNSRRGEVDGNL